MSVPSLISCRRGVGAALASASLLATLAITGQPAQADPSTDPSSTHTGAQEQQQQREQERFALKHTTGKQAVAALGSTLDKVGAESNLSAKQLEKALLDDKTLQVSDAGTLQVGDALGGTGATVATGSSSSLLWPVGDTNYLHSRSTSPRKIFLDFNGHTTTGTVWNTQYASFTTPVWGRDTDPYTFSSLEAAAIQQAYASVAEDFAPFDVDVTTQDPGIEGLRRTSSTDAYYGIRIVVGPNSWLQVPNSGYAQIGSFNWNSDTPAFCFADHQTPTKQIAECISHEAGHTVGLHHDGVSGGDPYYAGHGNWAPIMGNSYLRSVTQWSKGQYAGANQTQDDLYVIGNYLGWVADDYAGTTGTTATLTAGVTRTGRISYGSGELDAFRFSLTSRRTVNIQSWEWFQQVDTDLNMRLQLTNSAGNVIYTSSPAGNTRTNMTVTLNAGQYVVFVDGVGEGTASTGYTNYASMGSYNLLLQHV